MLDNPYDWKLIYFFLKNDLKKNLQSTESTRIKKYCNLKLDSDRNSHLKEKLWSNDAK